MVYYFAKYIFLLYISDVVENVEKQIDIMSRFVGTMFVYSWNN